MKILFVDIDGVMNSGISFKREWKKNQADPNRKVKINETLCPDACKVLQTILDTEPDLRIVISSTWRLYYSLDWLRDKFASYGVDSSRIIGITIEIPSHPRGDEISEWLKAHPEVTQYAILDDDTDMTVHGSRFTQTNDLKGLLPKHIKRVIKILNEKNR